MADGEKQIYDIHVVCIPGEKSKATAMRNGKAIKKATTFGTMQQAINEAGRFIREDMMTRGIVT